MQCISWFYNHYYKTLDLIEKILFKAKKIPRYTPKCYKNIKNEKWYRHSLIILLVRSIAKGYKGFVCFAKGN